MQKTTRLNYATRYERRIPRPRSRIRRDALEKVLLEHILMLWAIVLRVVLMFGILPGIPALSQNVLDAFLGDLDLFEEDTCQPISETKCSRELGFETGHPAWETPHRWWRSPASQVDILSSDARTSKGIKLTARSRSLASWAP
jgi:hypothetical protein